MKQPRTKRIQVRCQSCHYDQILKVATMERDRLEADQLISERKKQQSKPQ